MHETYRYVDEIMTPWPLGLDEFMQHLQRMAVRAHDARCYNAEVSFIIDCCGMTFIVHGDARKKKAVQDA